MCALEFGIMAPSVEVIYSFIHYTKRVSLLHKTYVDYSISHTRKPNGRWLIWFEKKIEKHSIKTLANQRVQVHTHTHTQSTIQTAALGTTD